MTRRGFLVGLGSLPFLGFAKRTEASPVQAESSPVQEAVGSVHWVVDLKHTTEPEWIAHLWAEDRLEWIELPRSGGMSLESIPEDVMYLRFSMAAPKGGER